MPPVRRATAALAAALAALAATAVGAGPAQAHGATASPVSRTMECGSEGGMVARSAVCQAAAAASGGPTALADFDNLRVPNVNGRDRQLIPDGQLCSGGLAS